MHRSRTALAAAAAGTALLGLVATGSAATASKPRNTSPPTVGGEAVVGRTLTGRQGTWDGSPTDYNTWWKRCDRDGGHCKNIQGTGGDSTYVVRDADVGHRIRYSVGAANADGRTWADSAPTNVVRGGKPTNIDAPAISGSPVVGATLTGSHGTWTGNPTDFNSWWRRCDAHGNSCANISGTAGHRRYQVKLVDLDTTLRYAVGAGNSYGRTWTASAPTSVIGGAVSPPRLHPNGCPGTTGPADISAFAPPARLLLTGIQAPSVVTRQTRTLILRFHVSSTCGGSVRGALVYVTATPFFQFKAPPEQPTDANGWAEVHMQRLPGFPVTPHQQLIVLYVRARKPGDSPLGGISNARLFSVRVNLHA